jgi:hypothetical protein
MAEASRILITGGGIAGLSLAIALRRRGYAPELAEQCPRWPAAGAGIALHANAVRALRELGLGEAVSRASAPLPRYAFYDQHGARLCTTDLDDLWGQAGPCLGITRVRLQEILAAAAAGIPHRLGVAVTGLSPAAWITSWFSPESGATSGWSRWAAGIPTGSPAWTANHSTTPLRGAWTGSGSTSAASDRWLPATSPP